MTTKSFSKIQNHRTTISIFMDFLCVGIFVTEKIHFPSPLHRDILIIRKVRDIIYFRLCIVYQASMIRIHDPK